MSKLYAIIDIETTGGQATRNKITEIAIVLHNGEKVIDSYETLINPECNIPYQITKLTGITQEMVEGAPKFYEVAKKIVEITEGAIFVAHNVRFDYSFVREEFARLGYTYTRKRLCTVRLARKAFPGLPSYSLGKLIKHFNIKVKDRHRAMADTQATVILFDKILAKEKGKSQVNDMVNLGIKEALLPKNINLEKLHALPETCGVYYFHDEEGLAAYVGKSINIKKRVAEHFAKKTDKASKLHRVVHDISFELTGSELVALLLESHEIKQLRPYINRAQRRRYFPYVIHTFVNEAGYICLDVARAASLKSRMNYQIVAEYPKAMSAKGHIKRIMAEYELCAKYCCLETHHQDSPCFPFHLKQCHGACIQQESPDSYNDRAQEALEKISTVFEHDFFLIDVGRTPQEKSVILVENGAFYGFGYIDVEHTSGSIDALRDVIKPYVSTPETSRIIRRFMSDNPQLKVLKF